MADTTELVYFTARGYAEVTRFALTVAGIQYTENDLKKREDYVALEPELPFGQVPLLRMDGLNIVQSGAVVRHVARKGKLYGDTDLEMTRIDMLYEGTRDFGTPFGRMVWMPEDQVRTEILQKTFPRYLPAFEKLLGGDGAQFLVGSRMSLADIGLMEVLLATVDYFGEEQFAGFPKIQHFYKFMLADDRVKKYVEHVRMPKNTPEIVANVKAILSHNY